jgi:hypothetical protein
VRFLNDFVVLHARIEIEQRGRCGRFDDRLRDVAPGEASDRFDRLPSRQDEKLDPILELTAARERHLLYAGDCLGFGPPEETTFANETSERCAYLVALARS